MPRLSKFKEHNDDHQIEICEKFDRKKYIISCKTFKINNADHRKFFFRLCQIDKRLLLFIPIVILEKMKRHVCGIETKR